MEVMKILLELPVIKAGKEGRRGEEDKAIKREEKSSKGLLIMLAGIRAEESIVSLSGAIRDNLCKTIIKTPLFKSLISSALILPVVVMIKFTSGLLPDAASAYLPT